MENNSVPYIAFEAECARLERIIKRLCITILVLVILLVGTNAAWLWYESQFADEVTSVEQEAYSEGDAPILMNNSGSLTYGK